MLIQTFSIFVSHLLNDVFAVADRIVVLRKGQVHSDDAARAVSMSDLVSRIVE